MELQFNDASLRQALAQLAAGLTDTLPLMEGVSRALVSVTMENFDAQGRPAWAGWSPKTAARRRGGAILQDEGYLKGEISHHWTDQVAVIGAGGSKSRRYAAVQQWGWPAHNLPARPYLPMDAQGLLQPEAEDVIRDTVNHYLRTVMP